MQICRFHDPSHRQARLGIVHDGRVYDLTAFHPEYFTSMTSFLSLANPADHLRSALPSLSSQPGHSFTELDVAPEPDRFHLLAPIDRQEVWAAGVTYLRSKTARMEESESAANDYDRVYDAPRPELFFKATPHRTTGPNAPVRIRRDSHWNVPEPELALVMGPDLELKGFTIGNDMSSRDIEGENPLYLPQAKVYLQCCALGPVITLADTLPDAHDLDIHLTIRRSDEVVFEGGTNTNRIKRRFSELIAYLGRDNAFPEGVFLLTGTGIVPGGDFTLEPGDLVVIDIEGIGTLRNTVYRETGAA